MRVLIATGFALWEYNERLYAKYAYSSIIENYRKELGEISLCCRIKKVSKLPPEADVDITGIIAEIIPVSRVDALLHKNNKKLEAIINNSDLVICRYPGFISIWVAGITRKQNKPSLAEIMGCGWDSFWNHGFLGKLVAPYIFLGVRHAVKKSDYALYVTQHFLQKRYPCKCLAVGVSDVVINDVSEDILEKRKQKIATMDTDSITLMTCAAIDVKYKGQRFVIRAIPKLNKLGLKVKYYCVGQGDSTYLKQLAHKYGVEDQVIFYGVVSHDKIFDLLDTCDIYIQPSLQEGLPRALVEAMSRGCPAIGAKTGGIPELLSEETIVRRRSSSDIAEKIKTMMNNGLAKYSEENFYKAKEYQKEILDKKRNAYFEYIKQSI